MDRPMRPGFGTLAGALTVSEMKPALGPPPGWDVCAAERIADVVAARSVGRERVRNVSLRPL